MFSIYLIHFSSITYSQDGGWFLGTRYMTPLGNLVCFNIEVDICERLGRTMVSLCRLKDDPGMFVGQTPAVLHTQPESDRLQEPTPGAEPSRELVTELEAHVL